MPYLAQSAPRWSWQQRTGLVLMGLLALWALLGPWLVDASPIEQNLRNQLAHPGAAHWLGTDVLGRSWLARLAHAMQLSLGMAVLAALYVGMATAMWVEYFRVCRAMARPVLVGDAVQASRLLGFGRAYVLRRHLLPALAPTLGTLLAFTTAQAVLALAALGFVGVGAQAPTAELGLMITEAMPYYEEAPWLIAAPTAVLLWLVAAMMLIQPEREAA